MVKRVVIGGAVVVAIVAAFVAYMFFKPPQEASAPIQSIPLAAASTAQPTTASAAAQPTAQPTEPPASAAADSPTTAPTTAAASDSAAAAPRIFEIIQSESQAQFMIDEVLEGAPKTVVGTTDQVAGQIAVDPANPAATQIGVIQVNARTLATDSGMRDRAIKNRILMTDQHEFITFTPTGISGLPAQAAVGETYTFQVSGDLTIKGVTKPATFDVTVTAASDQRLEGTASTTVRYADFEVAIPSVPMVAGVADEVKLALNFVAAPQG